MLQKPGACPETKPLSCCSAASRGEPDPLFVAFRYLCRFSVRFSPSKRVKSHVSTHRRASAENRAHLRTLPPFLSSFLCCTLFRPWSLAALHCTTTLPRVRLPSCFFVLHGARSVYRCCSPTLFVFQLHDSPLFRPTPRRHCALRAVF
ncbi:hypothetical protein TRVL_05527 [Trypanosoma vivax]|nr:hypothetical protein TRVL_05527 [Trypanosoma vivax]